MRHHDTPRRQQLEPPIEAIPYGLLMTIIRLENLFDYG